MDLDRLNHSISVARKMVEIDKTYNLKDNELQELFILGFNHDIGYEFTNKGLNHNVIGGNMLRESGYKFWQEVYNHGNPNANYLSLYLKILNMADMQIDRYGNDVGYEKRLEDIKNRYGEDSKPYLYSKQIVEDIMDLESCNLWIIKFIH